MKFAVLHAWPSEGPENPSPTVHVAVGNVVAVHPSADPEHGFIKAVIVSAGNVSTHVTETVDEVLAKLQEASA